MLLIMFVNIHCHFLNNILNFRFMLMIHYLRQEKRYKIKILINIGKYYIILFQE